MFPSLFSDLGIGRRAFAGMLVFLLSCLPFRHRVRRAKLRVRDLRSELSPSLCSPLRARTSLRAARCQNSVQGSFLGPDPVRGPPELLNGADANTRPGP